MSTLDINYFKKQSITYIGFTIFCLVFGLIYEKFSHGVYSSYMMYAFLIPLLFGFVFSIIMCFINTNYLPNRASVNLYNASLVTLTIYSIFKGILEIYGTTNSLIKVYLYVSFLLFVISLINYIINLINLLKRGNL